MTQEQQRAMQILQENVTEKILQYMWGAPLAKKKRVRRKMKKNDIVKGSN
jgi:hypothetical protein